MKSLKILFILILLALSNCVSNVNYSKDMKRHSNHLFKKSKKSPIIETEDSFIEKKSSEKKYLSNKYGLNKSHTIANSHAKTKLIGFILMGVLLSAFILKTIFIYIERKYKHKLLTTLKAQSKFMKKSSEIMKKNEMETCTFTTLIIATNREIIMHYKLKIIYVKAYTQLYDNVDCNETNCEKFNRVGQELTKLSCEIERNACLNFLKIKSKFSHMQNQIHSGIDMNMKILRKLSSNSCDQGFLYNDFDKKIPELDKRIEGLEESLGDKTYDLGHEVILTVFDSIKYGLISDNKFKELSVFRGLDRSDDERTLIDDMKTAHRVTKAAYIKPAILNVQELKENFETAFSGKEDKKLKSLRKRLGDLEVVIKENTEQDIVNPDDIKLKENLEVEIVNTRKTKVIQVLFFVNSCIDIVKTILSYVSLIERLAGGNLSPVFKLVNGILTVIKRIINVIISHIFYSQLTENDKKDKTSKYLKSRRKLIEAYTKLGIALVAMVFSPINTVLKSTFDAILKFIDMRDAIKQFNAQVKQKAYFDQLGQMKLKHSIKLKSYNICEAKFYGYKNILTVINTIIKDEIEMIKHKNLEAYNEFWNKITSDIKIRSFIKSEIRKLCSENIQFCSHNFSEAVLQTNFDFNDEELIKLKKEAIYGPYSYLAVASSQKEFKSFINLGYEPITGTENINGGYYFYNLEEKYKISKNEEKNTLLMGCRLCSKTSVIRHVEIIDQNILNKDDIQPKDLYYQYIKNNPDFKRICPTLPDNPKEIICKCIYGDEICLTKKIKSLRISFNKVIYYEHISRVMEDNGFVKEKPVYPGIDRIMIFWTSLVDKVNEKNPTNNVPVSIQINVGVWNTVDKNWLFECGNDDEKSFCDNNSLLRKPYKANKLTHYITRNNKDYPDDEKFSILSDEKSTCEGDINSDIVTYPILQKKFSLEDDPEDSENKKKCFFFYYLKYGKSGLGYIDDSKLLNPLNYNWIFFSTNKIGRNKKEFVPDFYEESNHRDYEYGFMDGGYIKKVSFAPFKPKYMHISEMKDDLYQECTNVCTSQQENIIDFNTCPNENVDYNYIVNKELFNKIDENDYESYRYITENQDKNGSSIYTRSILKPVKIFKSKWKPKEIDYDNLMVQEDSENTIFVINDKNSINKYIGTKFDPYSEMRSISKFYHQIHPTIYLYRTEDSSKFKKFFRLDSDIKEEDENYKLFHDNGYIMLQARNSIEFIKKNVINYFFVKPLPILGFKKSPLYGKPECIKKFIKNIKLNYIDKSLYDNLLEISKKNNITYDDEFVGFINLLKLKESYATTNTRSALYNPLDLFDFIGELGTLLFTGSFECKEKDFSFSVPMRFIDTQKYRKIRINELKEIEEYNDMIGPGIHEIYWLQFSKHPLENTQNTNYMTMSEMNGYFPLITAEYSLNDKIPINLAKYKAAYLKIQKNFQLLYVTVWVATDFRHSYDNNELCEVCTETKELLSEYKKITKDIHFLKLNTPIQNKIEYLTAYSHFNIDDQSLEKLPESYSQDCDDAVGQINILVNCFSWKKCNFAEYLNLFKADPKYIYNNTPLPSKNKFNITFS